MQVNGANQTDINAVLAQMRALRSQAQAGAQTPTLSTQAAPSSDRVQSDQPVGASRADFGATFKSAIDHVNQLQKTSSASSNDFLTGRSNDLVKVMVDGQKSSLGFQAVVQVRNRMVSAYQDIMNMPI